jgi:hypothetical protein
MSKHHCVTSIPLVNKIHAFPSNLYPSAGYGAVNGFGFLFSVRGGPLMTPVWLSIACLLNLNSNKMQNHVFMLLQG